ncbi:hypothetical protein [Niveibacterium sp. SC-1]|uniref:hypothetical protein n=1 Tax=Niveibacterium sp. SC-1 TaxID=3135646 RepID=UPI00311E6AF8
MSQSTARPTTLFHVAILLLATTATVLVSLMEGKDFSWDFVNYHLYGPFAVFDPLRLKHDFMAAGPQAYLNPVLHIPLYWMIQYGWPDWLASSSLAALHSLSIWCIYAISSLLIGNANVPGDRRAGLAWAVLASTTALAAPVFLGLAGSSFTDPSGAVLVLASVMTLLKAFRHDDTANVRLVLISGFLFGLALGAKLTHLIYAPAFFISTLVGASRRSLVRALAALSLGCVAGLILIGGYHAANLYREFGNPFFPLFNQYFQSPFYGLDAARTHTRFLPDSAFEYLIRPLRMAQPFTGVYYERKAPDVRLLALCVAIIASVPFLFFRRQAISSRGQKSDQNLATPAVAPFWAFFGASYGCWLVSGANGRYGLCLLLLVGPALVLAVRNWPKLVATTFVGVVLVAQVFLLFTTDNLRWNPIPWSGRWFYKNIDTQELEKPHGYLLFDSNSSSFLFPSLHPGSAYFAVQGQYSAPEIGPVRERLDRFISTWDGNLRVLGSANLAQVTSGDFSSFILGANRALQFQGLVVRTDDCRYSQASVWPIDGPARAQVGRTGVDFVIATCGVVRGSKPSAELTARRARIHQAFGRIQAACPSWFSPAATEPPVQRASQTWFHHYAATDVTLAVGKDAVFLSRYEFGPFDVPLGTLDQWLGSSPPALRCAPLPRHYIDAGWSGSGSSRSR